MPSPTFTLMQIYELPRFPVVHADLYRLDAPGELQELGFDDLPEGAVMMMEWPDRAAGFLPPDRLDIAFTLAPQLGPDHRNVRVTGYGAFAPRADRLAAIRRFLEGSGYAEAERKRIQGDASARSYERLRLGDQRAILMNAPRRPDGPPVRDGKPYSAIVHLAEDVKPFVAMANGLGQFGLSSPQIFEADIDEGLLIIEDFGNEFVVAGDPPAPVEERYAAAVDVLAALHGQHLPEVLPVTPNVQHKLPRYDLDAMLMEAELLLDWYLPSLGAKISDATRDGVRGDVARGAATGDRDRSHLGAAGFPFAQSDVAAGPRRRRQSRPAGFPGRHARPRRLRSRLAAAGCARRRAGHDGGLDARPLCAEAARSRTRISTRPRSSRPTRRWRRSAPRKSSASSRGSTGAITSRNTCVTSRAYGPICSAR